MTEQAAGRAAAVLLVEDDESARVAVGQSLVAHGYLLRTAEDGEEALRQWNLRRPDIVLLDLGLPGMDGLAVLRRIRREAATPVVILSARDQEREKVEALDAGADDYVTKPFGTSELHARIRAALRRAGGAPATAEGRIGVGGLEMDPSRRIVTVDGNELRLTPREYELLKTLLAHTGRVVTRGRLLRAVWGIEYAEESHYLHVYVSQVRRKIAALDPDGRLARLITAEPGVGYRVTDPTEQS
jgi:two-component system KDP operon response regulator KdpE